MTGAGPIAELRGVSVSYERLGRVTHAVRDLDLTVAPGETVALVGESGSGKSTTAHALLGLLPRSGRISTGSIHLDGEDVTTASANRLRELRGPVVALVPQDPMVALNPTMRIGKQVGEVVRRRGVDRRLASAEVLEALDRTGLHHPELVARQYPHQLSGGMRQRVLIAMALAGKPRLVVADEPTSALDVTVQRVILDHLARLIAETGTSLLVITHDLGVATDRADRVVVMQNGEVVERAEPAVLLSAPQHAYTRQLLAAAPGLAHGGRVTARHTTPAPSEEVLRLESVTKDFRLPRTSTGPGVLRALDDVSLTVRAGQTLGLVGESGSGKTTALRVAMRLEDPTAGQVLLDGVDVTGLGARELRPLRRQFQLVHQNPYSSLDPRFTVGESIAEPLVSYGVGTRQERAARVRELLDQVALPADSAGRRPSELSGGQRQRVAIARALALRPKLVALDEPVSALDVSVQAQVLRLLADLQVELGVSYLFISHDLAVVAQLSHHVAVLRRGELVESGTAAEVLERPQHPYTQELLAAVPGQRLTTGVA
jgi:peptide/nickel transport system ATP-binding protein